MHLADEDDGAREPRGATWRAFAVELAVFTGPFRLLCDLILEQKVDVCDVRSSSVTDRYLAHTKEADRWNLEEATWFLAICAVLLELKVGRLMPAHTEPDEEDLLAAPPTSPMPVRGASSIPEGRCRARRGDSRMRPGTSPATSALGLSSRDLYPDPLQACHRRRPGRRGSAAAPSAAYTGSPARDARSVHRGGGDEPVEDRIIGFGAGRCLPRAGGGLRGSNPRRGALPCAAGAVPGGEGRAPQGETFGEIEVEWTG